MAEGSGAPGSEPGAGAPARLAPRRLLALAAALALLNFALTFHNVWPTVWITTRHELSVEVAALVLALALLAEARGAVPPRLVPWLVGLLVLMTIGRYAEVTAPALYGRPVNLYWDARHVHRLAGMLVEASAPWLVAVLLAAVAAALAALVAIHRWALAQVAGALARRRARRALAAGALALVALYVAGLHVPEVRGLRLFSLPVAGTYWQQARFLAEALDGPGPLVPARERPVAERGLAGLGGADVLLIFLESYGAASFDRPAYARALAPARARLAAAVETTGRLAASAFVESPTFGGASWLAHTTLMTGLEVRDGRTHRVLLTTGRDTMPRAFARAGYRPVALMPGLRRAWPEGAFFGFERIYGEHDLAYAGPAFGWWRVPDQYALARLDALEIAPARRAPLFVFFPTITTHVPFRPTPPYQPDWSRMLGPEPFDPGEVAASLARSPDWMDLGPAYVDALAYAYAWLSGYLQRRAGSDAVVVVVGDHQPAASVSGAGAPWDVPVHVIARDPALIRALVGAGFTAGLGPARPVLGPMHALTDTILDVFAGAGSAGQARVDVARPVAGGEAAEEGDDLGGGHPGAARHPVALAGRPVEGVAAEAVDALDAGDGAVHGGGQVLERQ